MHMYFSPFACYREPEPLAQPVDIIVLNILYLSIRVHQTIHFMIVLFWMFVILTFLSWILSVGRVTWISMWLCKQEFNFYIDICKSGIPGGRDAPRNRISSVNSVYSLLMAFSLLCVPDKFEVIPYFTCTYSADKYLITALNILEQDTFHS